MINDISYYDNENYYGYKDTENFEKFLKDKEIFPIIKDITSIKDDYDEYRVIINCYNDIDIVVNLK